VHVTEQYILVSTRPEDKTSTHNREFKMAAYEYDEAGVMATYFLITFLALILVPWTLSTIFRPAGEYLNATCVMTRGLRIARK